MFIKIKATGAFYALLFFLLSIQFGLSQSKIEGKIVDENQQPIEGAHITLTGSTSVSVAVSSADGLFSIESFGEEGETLTATFVGYEIYKKELSADEQSSSIEIEMTPSLVGLQAVEVIGRVSKDYKSDYSFSATKIAIKNKDLPQTISSITKELILDRQAFQVTDVTKVVSSVTPSSFYNQHAIRGISQNEGGQIINGMRTRQFYFTQPLTSNIERVEVIKGPSSATFSSVDPGGSINLVTKKPLKEDRKSINLTTGSFNTTRGMIDFTGPLNESKTMLYRLNGAYQEAGSFRDLIRTQSVLISPSLTYIPAEGTEINAEIIYSDVDGYLDRGQAIFGAEAGKTDLNSTPISVNYARPNDFFRSKEFIFMGTLSQRLNENSNLNIRYMRQTWEEDLEEHRTDNAFALDNQLNEVRNLVRMRYVERQQFWNTTNLNAYLDFDFNLGALQNKLVVGYDFQSWEREKGSGQNSARGFIQTDGTANRRPNADNLDNFQTVTVGEQTLLRPNVDYFDLNSPSNTIATSNDYVISKFAIPAGLSTTHAAYIQDQLSFGKFKLLLSLRQEWFEDILNYKENGEKSATNQRLIPRVGLTFSVNDNINIYGTYLEGFQPQSNTTDLMPNTEGFLWGFNGQSAASFDPLISDLIEVGTKIDLFDKKVLINAAVYEINQKNILLGNSYDPDALVQRGSDRSRGFEVDITGYVTENWQIYASYAYIDAEITDDDNEELIGERKENTPVNSGNLWTRYNFDSSSALNGLGIGFGFTAQGSKVPWFTRDFEVPAFTTFDGAVYYTPSGTNVQLALNVNNITDETYWLGAQTYTRLFPGAPRNLMVSATYKF